MKRFHFVRTKNILFLSVLLAASGLFYSCEQETTSGETGETGTIEFKCINPFAEMQSPSQEAVRAAFENPPLTGPVTTTYMTSLRVIIGDVWVARDEVKVGQKDNLEWIRLTTATNREMKLFEEYVFPPKELPVGEYKSIKISLKNIFYRQVRLVSDPQVSYELLETMGSWTDPCNVADTSWAATNYFSTDGNHILNDKGRFEMASEGEKISSLTIMENKKATIFWRLGAGASAHCINYLIDENNNRQWDCGVDRLEEECPSDMKYMWDFLVEYEDLPAN